MPLGKKTKVFFEKLKQEIVQAKPMKELSIEEIRKNCGPEGFGKYATPFPEGVGEEDFVHHRLLLPSGKEARIQIYTPLELRSRTSPLPVIIYFYAGGFCLNLDVYQHGACARMANAAGSKIVTVDYPLAPEHSASNIVDFCYETIEYLYRNSEKFGLETRHFVLAGCSSGGTLAALVTNKLLNDPQIKILAQILISPLVDLSLETHRENPYASYQKEDLMLSDDALEYFSSTFASDPIMQKSSKVSPLYNENWVGLPETLIIVGEYDVLRGDGVRYAQILSQAGHNPRLVTCDGQTHNFLSCRLVLNDGDDPADIAGASVRQSILRNNIEYPLRRM